MDSRDETPAPIKVHLLETGSDLTFEKVTEWIERMMGRPLTEEEKERGRRKLAGRLRAERESK